MAEDREARCRMAPQAQNPPPMATRALRRQTPKVGAVCGKAACTDLCGGTGVTRFPTAITHCSDLRGKTARAPPFWGTYDRHFWGGVHPAARCLRRLSPLSSIRCELCIIRSRMASASVGLPTISYQRSIGTWLVIISDPAL